MSSQLSKRRRTLKKTDSSRESPNSASSLVRTRLSKEEKETLKQDVYERDLLLDQEDKIQREVSTVLHQQNIYFDFF
jgi:phage gp29-like protein